MLIGFFDTETTGLLAPILAPIDKQPHVYEYYLAADEICHHWIKPPIPIPAASSKITGTFDEDVKDCQSFNHVAMSIKQSIESLDELWAHNASFDVAVINYEFERLGLSIDWPKVRCSVEETNWLLGYRLNLVALHEYLFGEGFEGSHSAKTDVVALKKCVMEMKRRGLV